MLGDIYKLNDEAILSVKPNVEKITRDATRLMIVCIMVAMSIASYACYKLARSILVPIQALTRATGELGKGNLEQPVPIFARDELGDLAESFNKMAAQLRAYRQSTAEKIVRLHRTMESTLASFPDPVFVLDRDGGIELMNPAAMELAMDAGIWTMRCQKACRNSRTRSSTTGENYLPHSFKEVMSFRLYGKENFFLPRILVMRDENGALFGVAGGAARRDPVPVAG